MIVLVVISYFTSYMGHGGQSISMTQVGSFAACHAIGQSLAAPADPKSWSREKKSVDYRCYSAVTGETK